MTDEARIARLTELARRVWPGDEVEVRARGQAARVLPVSMPDTGMPQIVLPLAVMVHPRALDALEAALLVLAPEAPIETLIRRLQGALEPPRWVEQLASEWEKRAANHEAEAKQLSREDHSVWSQGESSTAATLRSCARELRARSKP